MNKVLIVEDEAITALNLRSTLKMYGYDVLDLVHTGVEAVSSAINNRPDIILMDITLADSLSGIDAAVKIREVLDVPIIYLTAHTDDSTITRAKESGPFGYLMKPIDMKTLKSTIEVALYKHNLELRLKESEERFRHMADHAPVLLWLSGPDKGCYFFNKQWLDFTGRTMEQEIGRGWLEGVHPEDIKDLLDTYNSVFELRGELKMQFRLRRHDGVYRVVAIHGVPRIEGQDNFFGYIGSGFDITERVELEESLKKRNKILEFFFDISRVFVEDTAIEKSLQKCTDAMNKHLGSSLSRIWVHDKILDVLQLMAQTCDKELTDDINRVVPFGGLKASSIIENKMPYLTNDLSEDEGIEYRSLALKHNWTAYAGYPLIVDGEAIGLLSMFGERPFDAIVLEALRASAETIAVGIRRKQVEQELKAKNLMLEDINTDLQKVALDQYRLSIEREQMLVQQSKLAVMGEMIGAIAHQWRQPLNAMALIVQGLDAVVPKDENSKELINYTIKNSMEQIMFMSKTIDDFRNFFRSDREKRDFYVLKAVEDILFMLQGQFKNNYINVKVQCPETIKIRGYLNEFKHVILNIINNAKDAILSARKDGLLGRIEEGIIIIKTVQMENGAIRISIWDNGGEIPSDILPKIFDSGFTTKEEADGTGLGLYMAKTIIEKHMNGKLTAKNTEGGAEFIIEL